MNWTKEIPIVDGYYWVRCKHVPTAWIDEIKNGYAVQWSYITDDGYGVIYDYKNSKSYEFYGPLEEPK